MAYQRHPAEANCGDGWRMVGLWPSSSLTLGSPTSCIKWPNIHEIILITVTDRLHYLPNETPKFEQFNFVLACTIPWSSGRRCCLMFPIPKASGCAVWTALGNSDGPSKANEELLYIVVEMNDGLMTGWLNKALLPVGDYPSLLILTISPKYYHKGLSRYPCYSARGTWINQRMSSLLCFHRQIHKYAMTTYSYSCWWWR